MSRRLRRIVLYAVNGSGMGHVTRLLSVARWLRRYGTLLEGKAPEVVFLTTSEATGVLHRAGFASFKLPSKGVVREAGMDVGEYKRLAKHFVWQVLGTFKPDLLVVDTFPSGSFDELFQVLDGPFAKALIVREVKSDYARRPVFAAAARLYDAVVAPHDAARIDQPTTIGGAQLKPRFAGEVLQIERGDLLPRQQARHLLGVAEDRRLVYLSAGGGGDTTSQDTLSGLCAALAERDDLHLLVGAGPLYRGPRLAGPRVSWWAEPGVARLFGGCDAAIAAAGYNTFHELLLAGVPSAFYAQAKIADDQAARARRAADAGACLVLGDVGSPVAVRRALDTLVQQGDALRRGARAYLPDNGARRCAQLLLQPIYDADRLARAAALLSPALMQRFEALPDRGAQMLARWLPLLVPEDCLGELALRDALASLLDRVGESAAEAIRDALEDGPDARALDAMQEALVGLLDRATAVGTERAMGTVEAGLRKHPLAQEQDSDWLGWTRRVIEGVALLLDGERFAPLAPNDLLDLYRQSPRLTDADARSALGAFVEFIEGGLGRGLDLASFHARLRALKASAGRVTSAALRTAWEASS